MAEICLSFDSWLKLMDNMHLKVHNLTINGMLRGCVEVVLKAMEINGINFLFEQTNGWCPKVIVQWRFWTFQKYLDLLTFLIKFVLLSWVNYIVFEVKAVVLEILVDWHVGVEVDWCLYQTIAHNAFLVVLKQIIVGSNPVVLNKLTWSFIECIPVVFTVVVVELALATAGSSSTTWHATNYWHTFRFTFTHMDILLTKIWFIYTQCAVLWPSSRVKGKLICLRIGIHFVITQLMKSNLSFVVSKLWRLLWNNHLITLPLPDIWSSESSSWNVSFLWVASLSCTSRLWESIESISAVPCTTGTARILTSVSFLIKIDSGHRLRVLGTNHFLSWLLLGGHRCILRRSCCFLWLEVVVRLHLLRWDFGLIE